MCDIVCGFDVVGVLLIEVMYGDGFGGVLVNYGFFVYIDEVYLSVVILELK